MSNPSNKSLTSLAFARIRNDILLGVLRPSERLKIQALSEHYGIGATAVREALSRLVTDGLVESEDQKGFCVGAVSREDLIDLTETRIAIESMALRKSIELGNLDWEAQVLSSYHRLSRTPAPTTIIERGICSSFKNSSESKMCLPSKGMWPGRAGLVPHASRMFSERSTREPSAEVTSTSCGPTKRACPEYVSTRLRWS